jgi:alcohol dehydrogenase class IV
LVEFSYAFPRKVVFGPNSVNSVPDEVARLASPQARVLLVTDKTIAQIGLSNKLVTPLKDRGHDIDVYSEISGEPTLATAESVSQRVRARKFDVVVGLGGGSCMDMAKIGAVAATNPGPIKEYIAFLEDRIKNKTLPKILIPTTAGTGSEATSYAVVVEGTSKNFLTSPLVVADVSIIDPALMVSCPPKQTAGSGLDALSQCVEPYLSKASDIFSDTFAIRGIQLISRNLKQAYRQGDNMEARSGMALGAFYGGIAITTAAGVILGHCISETIGPRYKIPHGLACGIALPYAVKFNVDAATERIASLLSYLSEEKVTGTKAAANKVVEVIRELVKELGVSLALKDYGISKEEALNVAKFIANEQQKNYALPDLNPRPINEAEMISLFEDMWQGKI